jgi:hypothetical protein
VVVVLANRGGGLPGEVAREVFSALLPEYARQRAEKEAQEREQKEQAPNPAPAFAPPPELIGEWSGAVHTYQGEIPFRLRCKESGDVHARLGEQLWTLLNNPAMKEETLTGEMVGDIGTEDANSRRYHLHASLRRRGDILNGALTAISVPPSRSSYALGHWVELNRDG